jgi:hypothetical protein
MKKVRLKYPCIVEVSQMSDFSCDPYLRKNRIQVCIGKLDGKFVSIDSKEEHVEWMLKLVKDSIKSGALSGLTLSYWNHARVFVAKPKEISPLQILRKN